MEQVSSVARINNTIINVEHMQKRTKEYNKIQNKRLKERKEQLISKLKEATNKEESR